MRAGTRAIAVRAVAVDYAGLGQQVAQQVVGIELLRCRRWRAVVVDNREGGPKRAAERGIGRAAERQVDRLITLGGRVVENRNADGAAADAGREGRRAIRGGVVDRWCRAIVFSMPNCTDTKL